jgi:hypothetical protein
MRRIKRVALVLAILALTGCSAIHEGTITDKNYRPAFTSTTVIYCGKGCVIPSTTYHPESWTFSLEYGDEDGWVRVAEPTYETYDVGDYYAETEAAQ